MALVQVSRGFLFENEVLGYNGSILIRKLSIVQVF